MRAVADGQSHGRESRTAFAEHEFQVGQARPHGTGQQATHLWPVDTDADRELFLRDPVQLQVPADEPRDLVLHTRRTRLRIRLIRPGPGPEPVVTKLIPFRNEVRRRVAKIHQRAVLVSSCAHARSCVAAFTIQRCTAHDVVVSNPTAVLETYTPHIPTDIWNELKSFVVETVRSHYIEGRTRDDIQHGLMTLTGFADWVYRSTEVAGFLAERERKRLRVIAGLPAGPEARHVSTTSDPQTPYTDDEQGEIRRWADWQSHEESRRNARAIAALGLGCGLTAVEMMEARVADVVVLDDEMFGVNANGRAVPVFQSWHDELTSIATGHDDEYLIGRGYTSRSSVSLRSLISTLPGLRPSVQRMRATWMLAHVEGGTPLPDFLDVAGLTSPDVLRRLLPFIRRTPVDARTRSLRLATEVAR